MAKNAWYMFRTLQTKLPGYASAMKEKHSDFCSKFLTDAPSIIQQTAASMQRKRKRLKTSLSSREAPMGTKDESKGHAVIRKVKGTENKMPKALTGLSIRR